MHSLAYNAAADSSPRSSTSPPADGFDEYRRRVKRTAGIVNEFHEPQWFVVPELQYAAEPGVHGDTGLEQSSVEDNTTDGSQTDFPRRYD